MKTRFNGSHHWPNVLSHIFWGLVGIGFGLAMIVFPILDMWKENVWVDPSWVWVILGIAVLPLSAKILWWEPIGYLKELSFARNGLDVVHLYGTKREIPFAEISECVYVVTKPRYGPGNPAVVFKAARFPFRFVLNMKGYSHTMAENLSKAINRECNLAQSGKKKNK